MRCPVTQILGVLFSTLFIYASVQAADKIRIAIPDPTPPYLTFPLAQKNGFFQNHAPMSWSRDSGARVLTAQLITSESAASC